MHRPNAPKPPGKKVRPLSGHRAKTRPFLSKVFISLFRTKFEILGIDKKRDRFVMFLMEAIGFILNSHLCII